jgi:hypothetical protein
MEPHGAGVGDLFPDIEEAWRSASKKLSTFWLGAYLLTCLGEG